MKCHSQDCAEDEIAEALGLRYDELWDEPLHDCTVCGKRTKQDPATGESVHPYCAAKRDGRPIPRDHVERRRPAKARAKIGRLPARLVRSTEKVVAAEKTVAEYEHVGADGEVIARSVRKEKWVQVDGESEPRKIKRFFQLFADGRGGWSRSKDALAAGTVVPIYRLPEVRLSILAQEPVHLVEGHKDVEAIVAARGEATTNIDGAKNLRREDIDQLAGAQVVVVCDRDLAGYRRGLEALELLDGVAESVEVVLPATIERKSDADDHLQAGYGLDQFISTGRDELERLAVLDQAESILRDVQSMPGEILAREERADSASSDEDRLVEHQSADRWAIEIAQKQFQAKLAPLRDELTKINGCTREEVRTLDTLTDQVRKTAVEAYGRRQLEATGELASLLGLDVDHDATPDDVEPDNVVDFPGSEYRGVDPNHRIPMSSMEWAYSLGDDGFTRGVYLKSKGNQSNPARWQKIAEMPYVHKRIVRRDGNGKRTGTHYLLSADPEGKPLRFDLASLKDGTWANRLGIELSQDRKVLDAVATATLFAGQDVPEQEATPDIDRETGKIIIPAGIDQYFEVAPAERNKALEGWREIVAELVDAPKVALVLGASAIAPFVHELGKSHTVSMTGGPRQGKSIALRLAAGVWGDSVNGNGSMYSSWNSTGQGLPRLLGTLRVLPAFRDETGLAGQSPDYWAKLAYQVSEGIDRLRYDRMTDYTMDKPWWGILFSTGNEQFADGCNNGRFQGVPRRIIDLDGPFTTDATHGDRLFNAEVSAGKRGLLETCYGHLGTQIAEDIDAGHAAEMMDRVEELVECPPQAAAIRHLIHMHVAGAMIIDEILDTGTLLTTSAVAGAQTYLDGWQPPAPEADQVIELIRDSISREPSAWPTQSEYAEHLLPFSDGDQRHIQLPQAGVARTLYGVMADDGSWVGVFSTAWAELIGPEVNKRLACRQLAENGVLRIQRSRMIRNEYVSSIRLGTSNLPGKNTSRVYKLFLPPEQTEDPAEPDTDPTPPATEGPQPELAASRSAESADVAGAVAGSCGSVAGAVAGSNVPLTRGVADVAGSAANASRNAREAADEEPAAVLVHAEGMVELDPDRPLEPWTDRSSTVRQRAWARTSGPCEVCGRDCVIVVEGHRVHLPLCWEQFQPGDQAAQARETTAAAKKPAPTRPQGTQTPRDHQQGAPAPRPVSRPRRRGGEDPRWVSRPRRRGGEDPRWAAPAAVLTGEQIIVPGQDPQGWEANHLGHIALLAEQYRLGWGGDADRMPHKGQLWLTSDAVTRLGLPTELELPTDQAMSPTQWRRAKQKALAKITKLPAVADATADGWEMGQAGAGPWTRIWHPELLRAGAIIVMMPWQLVEGVSLIDGDKNSSADSDAPEEGGPAELVIGEEDPAALADRLATFTRTVGIPYRFTPSITGLDLIDYTRPPRASHDDDLGASRRRVAVVRNEAADLPGFLNNSRDTRFSNLEADWSWWRPYEQLLDEEQTQQYVVLYDRGKSYLAPWSSIDLGVEGLQHLTGDQARWDGKAKPGYYLIDRVDWPAWNLPDPLAAAGARVSDGKVWVTSHTLQQLGMLDLEPIVHEAYQWEVTSRYLETAGKQLREALTSHDLDPAVLATIKNVYTSTVGKLGEREHLPHYHLWRPDWRHHIIAHTRTAILNQLIKINSQSGASPILVDRDTIGFVTDTPDPVQAWPGDPVKLGTGVGAWKPAGVAELAEWGPKHLVKPRPGQKFRYADAMNDTTLPEAEGR